NNWAENRCLKIASGYLKGAAAEWYKENKNEIKNWKTESENEDEKKKSFYHLLAKQFAPPERQHHWQIELNSLKQQEFEKVDVYASKFKKLLSRVNLDKGLAEGFIVGMFLSGLKKNNATFETEENSNVIT
ncbi:3613_t:CDS:2, partial [Gigaspora rosea]